MATLSATRRTAVLLVALLFGQLLLMSSSAKRGREASILEAWTMAATAPVVAVAEGVGEGVRSALGGAGDLLRANSRNAELEAEVAWLRTELRAHREAALENVRLRNLLGMAENLGTPSIVASVVTSNLSRGTKLLVVDRGARDGVLPDLAVVAWGGAVGRVITSFERYAKVRLITDPNSGVAGIVQRSRAQGVVLGQGEDDLLELLYVRKFDDVILGDRVVTSALDGIFPRGFGIGEVEEIIESPSGAQTVRLRAELDYRALEEVVILLEPAGGGIVEPPSLGPP